VKKTRVARSAPPVVAFSGPSGAGKTTLLVALVRELLGRGLRVAAIKHSGHPHGFDVPGKDSDLLLRAGALAVAVQGPSQLAVFGAPRRGGIRALVRLLPPVDLVLVEGWKLERLPRVEVHRRAVSREFACARARGFLAVVSDEPPPRPLPTFAPGEVGALADFLCTRLGLAGGRKRPRGRASM
jgi:molybdopterin-guanine dinucleotide biosynthesis protein MobB